MTQPNRSKKNMYLLSAGVLAITFILGSFTGAGIMATFSPYSLGHHPPPRPGGGHMFHPLPLRDLDLSAQQEKKVMQIMDKNRPHLDKIFEEMFPKLQKKTNDIEKEIREILTAKQKKVFDKMVKRRNKQIKHRRNNKPPKPPF